MVFIDIEYCLITTSIASILTVQRVGQTLSLKDHVQCMWMSSIGVGLDYDSTVILVTCKLLLAAAKAIFEICPDVLRQS